MDRRTMLRVSGAALLGLGTGGCAALRPDPERFPALAMPRIHAARDRVIQTLVGLRPFRPGGIRLEAEKLDEKTVIHNYGHGGAGVSLALGTGRLAAETALETGHRRAAVIGAGAVGLGTARQLQRRGFQVTVYTRAVWPHPSVCSGVAPARFTPSYSIIEGEHRTPAFDAFYEEAAAHSYRELVALAEDRYGVSWSYLYSLRGTPPPERGPGGPYGGLGAGESVVYAPGEHPFPDRYLERRVLLTIDTPVFLDAALQDLFRWGGRLEIRTFAGPRDVADLEEPVVVNCTGLGAREVAEDPTLTPLRGQLTALVPQPEVDFVVTGGGVSIVPRRNGLLLGGAPNRRGDWSLEPDEEAEAQVLAQAEGLFGEMGEPPGPRLARRHPGPSPGPERFATPGDPPRFSAEELSMELAF